MSGDPKLLTERQVKALEQLVVEARGYEVDINNMYDFDLAYEQEIRPGRGHDVRVSYIDGEYVATAYVDVYGNGSGLDVGEITWTHNGADDDCDCDPCEKERADDE